MEEKSKLGNVSERDGKRWNHLNGNLLKTTSEWSQSGPVIPLPSQKKWFYIFVTDNQGGTAGEEILIRPLQTKSREEEGFFYCLKSTEEGRRIR